MAGESLASFGLKPRRCSTMSRVKEAVFPFARFPGVDTRARPGDALDRRGHRASTAIFGIAFAKSQLGAGAKVPRGGSAFVSVRDDDKPMIVEFCRQLVWRRASSLSPRRAPRADRAGHCGGQGQQGARRAAAYRQRDEEWRYPAGGQHHRWRQVDFATAGTSAARR